MDRWVILEHKYFIPGIKCGMCLLQLLLLSCQRSFHVAYSIFAEGALHILDPRVSRILASWQLVCSLGFLFDLEDEGSSFPRNVSRLLLGHMVSYLRRQHSSWSLPYLKSLIRYLVKEKSLIRESWCQQNCVSWRGLRFLLSGL
jgi:hypothetical protein